jgi:hypothetical protein
MNPKIDFIDEYFKKWDENLKRARSLLSRQEFFLEGILVLSCYIGALSRLRYRNEDKDWKAYKQIVLEYSGKRDLYEKIDLLFFYQWPRSLYKDDKEFKKLADYPQLVQIFTSKFGDEGSIRLDNDKNRYATENHLLNAISSNPFPEFDQDNFIRYVKLFSNCEILYRYVRCQAVHENDFPLVNKVSIVESGTIRYEDNHIITGKVIYETVRDILENLRRECLAKQQWPFEL